MTNDKIHTRNWYPKDDGFMYVKIKKDGKWVEVQVTG